MARFTLGSLHWQVALQDPALMHVFDALEISADDAWNLFTQLDSELRQHIRVVSVPKC